MKDNNNNKDLVRAALRGEIDSYKALYKMHVKNMLINAKSIVGDLASAEDVVQESFIKAFQSLDTLNDPAVFSSWLRSIVYRKAIDRLKQLNKSLVFVEEIPETRVEEQIDINGLSILALRKAIEKLPSGCQSVLKMHVYEGLTHQEIGDFLGLSMSNSKSQYRYAIKRLKECLIEKEAYGT